MSTGKAGPENWSDNIGQREGQKSTACCSPAQATTAVTQLALGDGLTAAKSEEIDKINQEYLTSLLVQSKGGDK